MTRDELLALRALTSSIGWQMLVREFAVQREAIVAFVMNPNTPLEEAQQRRQVQAGVDDVLGWPQRIFDSHRDDQAPTIPRAGVGSFEKE